MSRRFKLLAIQGLDQRYVARPGGTIQRPPTLSLLCVPSPIAGARAGGTSFNTPLPLFQDESAWLRLRLSIVDWKVGGRWCGLP